MISESYVLVNFEMRDIYCQSVSPPVLIRDLQNLPFVEFDHL